VGDYGKRIQRAHKEWEAAHVPKELSWAEVARQCEKILKKKVDPSTVTRWKSGLQEPTLDEFRALGTVLDADPRWLAFGAEGDAQGLPARPPGALLDDAKKRRQGKTG
jgi:hypothetical protein